MSRRPPVTMTRLHPVGCDCGEDECLARQIKLDASAVYDCPGPARCDEGDAAALLRGPDDAAVMAARRGAR